MTQKENTLSSFLGFLSKSYVLDPMGEEDEEQSPYSIPFNFAATKKGITTFKENTKSAIRNSVEYKNWVRYFRDRYAPPVCCLSGNTETIEVHHHPLTLEDYFDIALEFVYRNGLQFTSTLVADIVLRWHYSGVIGACFLCKTEHVAWHKNHEKFIPEEEVHGDILNLRKDFIISSYLNEYHISKIAEYMPRLYCDNKEYFGSTKRSLKNVTLPWEEME